MFRLSADIGKAALLAGDYSADERLAAFLLGPPIVLPRAGWAKAPPGMSRGETATTCALPETVGLRQLWTRTDQAEGREVEVANAPRCTIWRATSCTSDASPTTRLGAMAQRFDEPGKAA